MKKYYVQFNSGAKSDTINIVANDFEKALNFIKNHKFDDDKKELFKVENIVYVSVDYDVYIAE